MTDRADPVAILLAGSAIVGGVLSAAGFTFEHTETGHSSGSTFAAPCGLADLAVHLAARGWRASAGGNWPPLAG
jgi:hypothetical protein